MKLFLSIILLLTTLATHAATPTNNVPISQMPITTNVIDNAYFPLIQPYPGRTTNDNFRATTASIFTGRGTGTFTNIYVTNLFVTNLIMLAGTNVASVNPTIGRIPYKDTTNTFGDSALYFIDTNTVGTVEIDTSTLGVTNLVTGGLVQSVDSGMGFGYLTNVVNGTGALTNDGAGNLGWSTVAAASVAVTNYFVAAGSRITVVTNIIGTNVTWTLTPAAETQAVTNYALANGGNVTIVTNVSGTNVTWTASVAATPSVTNYFLTNAGNVTITTNVSGTNVTWSVSVATATTINATDTYLPARLNSTTFTNSGLYTVGNTNIGLDGQLLWGPGTTNVLFRSGTDLILTNGGSSTTIGGLRMMTGDGSSNFITAAGNLAVIKGVSGVGLFDNLSTGNEIRWTANQLEPINTGSLGQDAAANGNPTQWKFVSSKTNFINGFVSSLTTNYSRLALSHGGTNDFGYIDSAGSGTAGTGKPILVRVGLATTALTNVVQFDGASGASTTGILIYENGTAQRVSIGANDSGGAGFRVLRVPN